MGPSGTGKTTLLRILLGRETADAGEIEGIAPGEIAAMFQEDRLCPTLSAVQNVALVCKGKVDEKQLAEELSQILPPNSLHQPISQLSGGMKRRVALARAMHYPCRMIVLDEPFTGLDQNTRLELRRGRGLRRAAQLGGDPDPHADARAVSSGGAHP